MDGPYAGENPYAGVEINCLLCQSPVTSPGSARLITEPGHVVFVEADLLNENCFRGKTDNRLKMGRTMIIKSIQEEFQKYRSIAERAIGQIDDSELYKVVEADGNSVAILLNHLSSNLTSRFTNFLTEDGEKPWRNRDAEFEPSAAKREELLGRWAEALELLNRTLNGLSDSDLSRIVIIRRQNLSVIEALTRSLAHFSYHVGQIVLLCRGYKGAAWQNLSIPRGGSAAYNLNPEK